MKHSSWSEWSTVLTFKYHQKVLRFKLGEIIAWFQFPFFIFASYHKLKALLFSDLLPF